MCSNENSNEDESFVELFKKEHTEQFYVLVKMHLSFLLNMTTEESECFYEKVKLRKWNLVPFGKKGKHRNVNEGASLNQESVNQIHQLINFIKDDENLKAEGIFRRTGSLERQNDLKNLLLQGQTINFQENSFTLHDCASVLKGFLSELPEPLTTDIQFPIYCQIAETLRLDDPSHETKILQSLQLLFLLLPKENKHLLRDIFELLYKVTLYEKYNRMSSENLAKLFTPHLLCPRKLAPELLLKDSQTLFGTVAFMIRKLPELFNIPTQVLVDFRAHYEQASVLNDSVKGAAHTVFTFVDNKLTAKENEENVTETALAQLYAHIQSLPESSKKRKLVKQFNKENGQGTPLQVIRSSVPKNKSFGDSIKKHMFHKKLLKNVKRSGFSQLKNASSDEVLNSPHSTQKTSRGRLFCHNLDSSSDDEEKRSKRLKSSHDSPVERRRKSDSDLALGDVSGGVGQYLTSTPACRPHFNSGGDVFTPEGQDRKSMSPITRSAQRMPRAMQETMMTPRSRKPVLLVSGTNINNLAKVSPKLQHLQEEESNARQNNETKSDRSSLLHKRGNNDTLLDESGVEGLKRTLLDTDVAPGSSKKPFVKSKSDGHLNNDQKLTEKEPKMNKTDSPKSLSNTFKQYLNSRDMLIFDSPTDSSFSSRSDDFQSYSELHNESLSSINNISNPDHLTTDMCDGKMTDSMLYILNGNSPNDSSLNDSQGEKKLVLKPRQFDKNGKAIVFETSF